MRLVLACAALAALCASAAAQGLPDFATAPATTVPASKLGGGFIEFLVTGGRKPGADTAMTALPRAAHQRPWQPAGSRFGPQTGWQPGMAPVRPPAAESEMTAVPREDVVPAAPAPRTAAIGPESQPAPPSRAYLDRQEVDYATKEPPGTIVVDTKARFLYLVQEDGRALRYGVGVGREGFEWSGVEKVSRKREWPDWRPPREMLARRPDLPRYMPGGPDNPLGARALYLGSSLYRIHGSNEPETIGRAVSSGCIRMRNDDVIDLYERVGVGTRVRVM